MPYSWILLSMHDYYPHSTYFHFLSHWNCTIRSTYITFTFKQILLLYYEYGDRLKDNISFVFSRFQEFQIWDQCDVKLTSATSTLNLYAVHILSQYSRVAKLLYFAVQKRCRNTRNSCRLTRVHGFLATKFREYEY